MAEFIRGARTALRITSILALARISSKAAQNEASRSSIGNLARTPVSSMSIQAAGLLHHPVVYRMGGRTNYAYLLAGMLDHPQNVGLGAVEQVDDDEVGREDRACLRTQELGPASGG